jgi:hypothetical protein
MTTTIIRRYWHIVTAIVAAAWIAGSALFGWVGEVNAHVESDLTKQEADLTYVRKDVQSEQLRRIEAQLRVLNENFEKHMEREHE